MAGKCPKLTRGDLESKFQEKIIKWLKTHGCNTVFKMTPGAGIPSGVADLLFLKEGLWGFLECKQSKSAKYRPGQKEFLLKHDKLSYAKAIYPENEKEILKELEEILK